MTMLYINIKKTIERGYQGYRDPNQNSISCCVYILQGFPDFAHPTERERKRDEREKERERDREKERERERKRERDSARRLQKEGHKVSMPQRTITVVSQ